jgi:hypothetical protein
MTVILLNQPPGVGALHPDGLVEDPTVLVDVVDHVEADRIAGQLMPQQGFQWPLRLAWFRSRTSPAINVIGSVTNNSRTTAARRISAIT